MVVELILCNSYRHIIAQNKAVSLACTGSVSSCVIVFPRSAAARPAQALNLIEFLWVKVRQKQAFRIEIRFSGGADDMIECGYRCCILFVSRRESRSRNCFARYVANSLLAGFAFYPHTHEHTNDLFLHHLSDDLLRCSALGNGVRSRYRARSLFERERAAAASF